MVQGICRIEDCGNPIQCRELCWKHYQRLRAHGDPNIKLTRYDRRPAVERFFERFERRGDDECWPWTGSISNYGYGTLSNRLKVEQAHRFSYELFVGPIPEGMEIDHLCHGWDDSCRRGVDCPHRRCVNPAHMEVVTKQENTMRGRNPLAENARKTHCPKGHPFSGDNLRMGRKANGRPFRICKECARIAGREWRRKGGKSVA